MHFSSISMGIQEFVRNGGCITKSFQRMILIEPKCFFSEKAWLSDSPNGLANSRFTKKANNIKKTATTELVGTSFTSKVFFNPSHCWNALVLSTIDKEMGLMHISSVTIPLIGNVDHRFDNRWFTFKKTTWHPIKGSTLDGHFLGPSYRRSRGLFAGN